MGLLVIVDVRSDAEWGRVRVPGATHIPLGQVARRLHEVRPTGRSRSCAAPVIAAHWRRAGPRGSATTSPPSPAA